MIKRSLIIGRWYVEIYFADDGFDSDTILDRMYDFGISVQDMRRALEIMESGEPNKGFTAFNPIEHLAIIAIGPTTSGAEFQDTVVHEIHHMAVIIASSLGIDLEGETPAYLSGDSMRDVADVVCRLGCDRCREDV